MDLRQLEYFVAVAEELHFGRAAERLHLAQQPLSFKIKQLEEEMGVLLFQRTTRRVELTDAGELFLREVRQSLQHLQRGITLAQQVAQGERGCLVVGYISPALYNILPDIMHTMKTHYPHIQITLREMNSPFLEEHIANGQLDAGILAYEHALPELAWMPLFSEPIAVVLPKDHRLAHQETIALNALADDDWILYDRTQKPLSHEQMNELCRYAGFRPRIVQEAASAETMVGLVSAGIGVSLGSYSMRDIRKDDVVFRPLVAPALQVEFGIAWKQDNESVLLQAFRKVAQRLASPNISTPSDALRLVDIQSKSPFSY